MPDILIFGEITQATAKEVALALKKDVAVTVRINSAGGDASAGLAIYNAIRTHGKASISVEGMCASAATLICCAGYCRAAANSIFMLHSPWLAAENGNAKKLRESANVLDIIESRYIAGYARKTGKSSVELKQVLDNGETWFTADEAQSFGLCDEVVGDLRIAAAIPEKMELPDKFFTERYTGALPVELVTRRAHSEFASSPSLQNEFREAGIYVAYKRGLAAGRIGGLHR